MNVSPIQEEWLYIYACRCGEVWQAREQNSSISFGEPKEEYWTNGKEYTIYPILCNGTVFHNFLRLNEYGGYLFRFFIQNGKIFEYDGLPMRWRIMEPHEANPAEKAHSCAIKQFAGTK